MSIKLGDILVGLDIGTNKTCAVIGEVSDEGLKILGAGETASKGIQKGGIINIEAASQSIQKAIEKAEIIAKCRVSSVIVNITGNHIQGTNSNGVAKVSNCDEISDDDISRVLETARAVRISPDREFLHVIAQDYIVDGTPGIRNPRGMSGVRLEAKVHIITAVSSCIENIVKSVDRCRVDVTDVVLSSLASGESVLTEEEKEIGCVLVDLGSGTTDIAIWSKGAIVHTHTIGIAGNSLTSDLAKAFQMTLPDAETVKIHSGCAMVSSVGAEEIDEIPLSNGRDIHKHPRQAICGVIEPRLEEIFEMVNREIVKAGIDKSQIPGGIILTGGTSVMDAVPELAERVLELPARRGVPRNISGLTDFILNPKYATVAGLMLYVMNQPTVLMCNPQDAKNSSFMGKFIAWIKQII